MVADEIHYFRSRITFSNPFKCGTLSGYMHPMVLVVWRGQGRDTPPAWSAIDVEQGQEDELRVCQCVRCGKYRIIPRCQEDQNGLFECSQTMPGACAEPYTVYSWEDQVKRARFSG